MNLLSLRCFLAVADELHFGRAAARLNMSQPPLTQRIKTLEAELGAELFHRTKRSVQITAAGTALLDQARALVAQADGLRHLVQRAKDGRNGFLRAGFLTSVVFSEMRSYYTRLSAGVPGITVTWEEMNSAAQATALRDGGIDIAFAHMPISHRDLEQRIVMREPLVIAIPDCHPLSGETSVKLSDFGGDDFIFPLRHISPGFYDQLISACLAAGITPTIPHSPGSLLAITSLVSMHAGVSLVPKALSTVGFPGVCFLPLQDVDVVIETAVLWNRTNTSPVLARALDALGFRD